MHKLTEDMAYGDKFKKETIFSIDYGDFEDIVEKEYGHYFDVVGDTESSNYFTLHYDTTNPSNPLEESWNKDRFQEWLDTGEKSYMTSNIVQHLAFNNKIPRGTITIKIFW